MILKVWDPKRRRYEFFGDVERCAPDKAYLGWFDVPGKAGRPACGSVRTFPSVESKDVQRDDEGKITGESNTPPMIVEEVFVDEETWQKALRSRESGREPVKLAVLTRRDGSERCVAFSDRAYLLNNEGETIERL